MKRVLFVVLVSLINLISYGQNATGDWYGNLEVQPGMVLPLVFHITEADGTYSGTLDSPDQKAFGIPITTVTYTDANLQVEITNMGVKYTGTVKSDTLVEGTFTQGPLTIPLQLTREAIAVEAPNRPQEPQAPFPYTVQEVTFENKAANAIFSGTITLPKVVFKGKKKLPAVILISGSGPQDRNEELLGHKPFLVIADYLTRNGIAVLRYDDRGTAKSTGKFTGATSADFATDAQAAFDFLKTHPDIDASKIGFAGHSEGGLIAPMVAATNKEVAFIALIAGVGQPGDELLMDQGYLIGKAQGLDDEMLRKNRIAQETMFNIVKENYGDTEKIKTALTAYLENALDQNPEMIPEGSTKENLMKREINTLVSDWFQYLIITDPRPTLEKVTCPVLAINGSLDLQVPSKKNLDNIEESVKKGGNTDVTIVEFPNLNHLFQTTTTGSPSEYALLEETFSPDALKVLSDWIIKKTK
ncbi:acyl-CoA thioester hydrolase/BAAT C-terminal domain-containing protein [uncultured Dokdonia sp.]|uniref:alpha/beta hydrolase family protein n=1 Tax=uncultured Dokdonia sp. TaxID=575653 RepID=UPI0026238C36|nr:acyl-CoA thioester hydrolase/BAAT C-terminal domain-containing protein [uncultured Dokdonia sp.]